MGWARKIDVNIAEKWPFLTFLANAKKLITVARTVGRRIGDIMLELAQHSSKKTKTTHNLILQRNREEE